MATQTDVAGTGSGTGWTNATLVGIGQANVSVAKGTSVTESRLYGSGFGFAIPVAATINGITVQYTVRQSATNNFFGGTSSVQLTKVANTNTGGSKFPSTSWTSSDVVETQGGSSDLWSNTWSSSDINSSGFGFGVTAFGDASGATASGSLHLGIYTITVTYTPHGGVKTSVSAIIGF
jgi:hypothetical protein